MSPAAERFLVTGAVGCIGAWTVRTLVRQGAEVTAFDLGTDTRRLAQIMTADELASVDVVRGDITDLAAISATMDAKDITNVIHLAALQVPFCRADPPRGAMVNVVGTVNIFEAVKRRGAGMAPIVYTSSIGMYAADDADPATGRLAADARAHPHSHYGVYKLANEGNARVYWLEDGIPSVGLRPMIVYGVGRDQGMTSGPTKGIVAAVIGQRYTVSFGGAALYQYAEDAAHMLVAASRGDGAGANVFNMPGTMADGAAARRRDRGGGPGGTRPDRLRAREPAVPGRDRPRRHRGPRPDPADVVRGRRASRAWRSTGSWPRPAGWTGPRTASRRPPERSGLPARAQLLRARAGRLLLAPSLPGTRPGACACVAVGSS